MINFIRKFFRLLCNIIRAGNDILDELNEKLDEHHDNAQEAKKHKKRIDNWDVDVD